MSDGMTDDRSQTDNRLSKVEQDRDVIANTGLVDRFEREVIAACKKLPFNEEKVLQAARNLYNAENAHARAVAAAVRKLT